MFEQFTAENLSILAEVIGINLVLSGDNAIVIGLAAAGLPREMRAKAILFGIVAATVMRIVFAAVAVQLLDIPGLLLIGGLVLLWVCWGMFKELRDGDNDEVLALEAIADRDVDADGKIAAGDGGGGKSFRQAAMQIVVADLSMSLDNVLAVAGASREHTMILAFGLILSIVLMGLAANFIAALLGRYRWIAYVGLAIILYVAGVMIWEGGFEAVAALRGSEA